MGMKARMTLCNLSIEGGARCAMVAPDDTTFDWLRDRPYAPTDFDAAVARWRTLPSDPGAVFDRDMTLNAADIAPLVTWGTTPGQHRRRPGVCRVMHQSPAGRSACRRIGAARAAGQSWRAGLARLGPSETSGRTRVAAPYVPWRGA
jgi:hypothetical protein